MKVQVSITQEDIDAGLAARRKSHNVCAECAAARAISRAVGHPAEVGFTYTDYVVDDMRYRAELPRSARDFVTAFTFSHPQLHPLSFALTFKADGAFERDLIPE